MTHKEFQKFEYLVFGLDSLSYFGSNKHSEGFKQTKYSFLNMILSNFVTITNLYPVITHKIEGDHHLLAQALTQCTLLLIGANALTPSIIQQVWGANETVRRNLGGPRGDLALIRCRLISLSAVTINAFYLWTTTDHNNTRVITPDALQFNPPGLCTIIDLIAQPSAATYVRKPLAPGTDRVNILLDNIHNSLNPTSSTFEDMVVTWYFELLLCKRHANNSTGIANGIFAAYGVPTPST
jgi:hypothetical protein